MNSGSRDAASEKERASATRMRLCMRRQFAKLDSQKAGLELFGVVLARFLRTS